MMHFSFRTSGNPGSIYCIFWVFADRSRSEPAFSPSQPITGALKGLPFEFFFLPRKLALYCWSTPCDSLRVTNQSVFLLEEIFVLLGVFYWLSFVTFVKFLAWKTMKTILMFFLEHYCSNSVRGRFSFSKALTALLPLMVTNMFI